MPQQPTERRSFLQDYAFAQWLMQFPALTLILFLRRDVGFRLLHPLKLIVVFGLLAVASILAMPGNEDARPVALLIFALLGFSIGLYQRFRRWYELHSGQMQHSYYIGSSPFDFQRLPSFCRRNRRIARIIDPIFCAVIGMALFPLSHALSMWVVVSAFSLRSYEHQIYRNQRNLDLDLIDSLIVSQRQSQVFEQYEDNLNPEEQHTSGSVPTGLGDDIRSHIHNRRSSKG
jgi:hypothetical protein